MMMNTWGAECIASPSNQTDTGRAILAQTPDTPGSLAMAISEAIEDAFTSKDTRYSLGSVLNHVLLHQTVIGLEAQKQFSENRGPIRTLSSAVSAAARILPASVFRSFATRYTAKTCV